MRMSRNFYEALKVRRKSGQHEQMRQRFVGARESADAAKQQPEMVWRSVHGLVVTVPPLPRLTVDDVKRRHRERANQGDSVDHLIEGLAADLRALLVEPARQRAQAAHNVAEAIVSPAEEALRVAAAAAEVLSAAQASTQTATQIAAHRHQPSAPTPCARWPHRRRTVGRQARPNHAARPRGLPSPADRRRVCRTLAGGVRPLPD
jgi:hypothetical protein